MGTTRAGTRRPRISTANSVPTAHRAAGTGPSTGPRTRHRALVRARARARAPALRLSPACQPARPPCGQLETGSFRRSAEAEHGEQRVVDAPELLAAAMTCEFAEPLRVDGADLFDKYPGALTIHLDD